MVIRYLLEKEFKQIFRNPIVPRLIVFFPVLILLVMPWAANMEIKNIKLGVVDHDHSAVSDRLMRKATASGYFQLAGFFDDYESALQGVEAGAADLILEIPSQFERDLVQSGVADVAISANTVNGTKGMLGVSYLSTVIQDFSTELQGEAGLTAGTTDAGVNLIVENRFNPHLDYKVFMVPALMVMLLTILCGFLPAFNIVSEKEIGTIEQINVTPLSRFAFIFGKLIPYWVAGFVVLSICLLLAWLIYGLTPVGSLATVYFFALLYVLVISGFGLVVSNYSETMQQAMFVMFFFIIVFLLMSGLFTPVRSMPGWAQAVTTINPLKYFIQVMRQVYLKGSGIGDLWIELTALLSFAAFFNGWAILSYRKRS